MRGLVCALLVSVTSTVALAGPARIVSTSPSITEILFALGLGDRVVGVSRFCRYPADVVERPTVGTFLKPDVERIARLHPDLTILQGSQHGIEQRLQMLALPSLTVERGTLLNVFRAIRAIGTAAHAPDRAEALIARLDARLARVRTAVAGRPAARVLIIVGRRVGMVSDLVAAAERTYLNDLVQIAGGANVLAGQTPLEYPRVSMETVVRLAPDVIVDASHMADTEIARLAWRSSTEALWRAQPLLPRETRMHVAISDAVVVPGPRLVEVVETFARWFHDVQVP